MSNSGLPDKRQKCDQQLELFAAKGNAQ